MEIKLPLFKNNDKHIYQTNYIPKFINENIDISDLLKKAQDIAFKQVEVLSLGEDFCVKNNCYYVLCRLKGYFLKKIEKNHSYILVTYPIQASTLQLYRYFYILDENNNVVFYMITLWILIDRTTRKIKIATAFKNELKNQLSDIEKVEGITDEKLSSMSYEENNLIYKKNYIVQDIDIDHNKHMNNSVYMKISQSLNIEKQIQSFEINFEKECFLNEELEIYEIEKEEKITVVGKKDNTLSFITEFNFNL